MELLDLLKNRLKVAENFTKEYHDSVKKWLKDYDPDEDSSVKGTEFATLGATKRYNFKIPYIFATHESMMSSMFDRPPDLVISGRGSKDEGKQKSVTAAYEYIKSICDIEMFMNTTAWWLILTGNVSANAYFKTQTKESPILDDMGTPMLDANGEPVMQTEYIFNDPILEADEPLKTYWSPESQFTESGKQVPYRIIKTSMTVEAVKEIYGKKVDPDSEVDVKGDKDFEKSDDLKRVTVYLYEGTMPKDTKGLGRGWAIDSIYHCVFTKNEVLNKDVQDWRTFRLAKLFGRPDKFFGFGIGKTLSQPQKELSIRRGQEIRYADLASYPKIAIEAGTEYDEDALNDPRANVVLTYGTGGKPPVYLTPPAISETLLATEQKAREDAQFISGQLDLSKGAQQTNTVKTATGQQIFANDAEKRIQRLKNSYIRFYREVVILLLKLAQKYWDDDKLVSITDSGGMQDVVVNKESLKDIDFDKDIQIDAETLSINRDVLRAQAIDMYDRTKDDQLVNREEVIKDVFQDGFNKKDPSKYIVQPQMQQEAPQGLAGALNGQPMAQPTNGTSPTAVQTQPLGGQIPTGQ